MVYDDEEKEERYQELKAFMARFISENSKLFAEDDENEDEQETEGQEMPVEKTSKRRKFSQPENASEDTSSGKVVFEAETPMNNPLRDQYFGTNFQQTMSAKEYEGCMEVFAFAKEKLNWMPIRRYNID